MTRKTIFAISLLMCFAIPSLQAAVPDSTGITSEGIAELLIREASRHLGTPYRYGARGKKAFDCSGFTHYVYGELGFELPISASFQFKEGYPVEGGYAALQKGDLVFFTNESGNTRVTHVGMFISMDETGEAFTFIHASRGGVQISSIRQKYYSERYLGARRILPTFNILPPSGSPAPVEVAQEKESAPPIEKGRIINLFDDGTWSFASTGPMPDKPEGDETIMLNPDGTWMSVRRIVQQDTLKQSPPPAKADTVYHRVRRGDTLYSLSRKYGTTIESICKLNGISRRTVLDVGRRLRIK